jgi:hypothetical protein
MSKNEHRDNIDTILSYILIKKLVTPITKTMAFKMKLVNAAGKVVKEPQTDKEHEALTLLDRVTFKLKRLLGSKLLNLNNFLYVSTLSNDFYNKLVVRGTIKQRAEILRITKDVKKLQEAYQMNPEEMVYSILQEEIQKEME